MTLFFAVRKDECESEDNAQCVPTSCEDHYHENDNISNPGTSQVIVDNRYRRKLMQTILDLLTISRFPRK